MACSRRNLFLYSPVKFGCGGFGVGGGGLGSTVLGRCVTATYNVQVWERFCLSACDCHMHACQVFWKAENLDSGVSVTARQTARFSARHWRRHVFPVTIIMRYRLGVKAWWTRFWNDVFRLKVWELSETSLALAMWVSTKEASSLLRSS